MSDSDMTTQTPTKVLGSVDIKRILELLPHRYPFLLVDRIIVSPNELQVKLHPNGVENLALDVIRDPGRSRSVNLKEEALA